MNEREKLIKQLEDKFYVPWFGGVESMLSIEGVADFIIADRKRIVAPLKEILIKKIGYPLIRIPDPGRIPLHEWYDFTIDVISATLKKAGEL